MYRPVRDFITDSAFLCAFYHDSTTFATDPRVVGSVTGSAPVEHLHKEGLKMINIENYIMSQKLVWIKCLSTSEALLSTLVIYINCRETV